MAAIRRRAIQEQRNVYTPSRTMSRMFLNKNLKTDWTVFEKMVFKVTIWAFFDENGRHLWPPYRDERFNSNETYTHHQGPCLECSQIKISKLIEQFLRKWHSKSQNGHFSTKTAAILKKIWISKNGEKHPLEIFFCMFVQNFRKIGRLETKLQMWTTTDGRRTTDATPRQ